MPDEPLPDDAEGLRAANAGLRSVAEARDTENALLRAGLDAERELRLAELERRLGIDGSDPGTPSSKERTGAKEARRAARPPGKRAGQGPGAGRAGGDGPVG